MAQDEIKSVVYTSISCMVLACLLGFAMFFMNVKSDLAIAENERAGTEQAMQIYYKYNKYQDALLYGEDVLAIIREFADSDTVIYIKGLTDAQDNTYNWFINRSLYLENPAKYSLEELNYGNGPSGLRGGIKRDVTYYSYLVFGVYNESEVKDMPYSDSVSPTAYGSVSGIVIRKVADGRHSYAPNPASCGCGGDTALWGPCTATTIYNTVNRFRRGLLS